MKFRKWKWLGDMNGRQLNDYKWIASLKVSFLKWR